ncbi:phage holin family protein [Actinomadura sp. 9N407]|uniref:phage holin family protein n=1 Tax=Actinomadura sp. 9N407 TaxID=3375154 RepID=UPI00378FD78E
MSTVRPPESGRTESGTAESDARRGGAYAAIPTQPHGAREHEQRGTREPGHGREHGDEQGIGELVSRATQQLSDLVRAELRLAVAELKDKGKHAGTGAGLFGAAGLVALFGAGALVACVIALLALAMPVWVSALIVGVVLLAIAGVLALMGRGQTKRAVPPVPEGAMDSTRQDVAEIKGRAHR